MKLVKEERGRIDLKIRCEGRTEKSRAIPFVFVLLIIFRLDRIL